MKPKYLHIAAKAVATLAIVVVLAMIILKSSGDTSDASIPPKDYVVYFVSTWPVQGYYGYHVATGKIDRLNIPFPDTVGATACSPGGRLLYIPSGDSILAVNTRTQQVEDKIPYPAMDGIASSADGRYLAINGDPLRLVRLSDHAVVYEDTMSAAIYSTFSVDNTRLYYVRWNRNRTGSAFRVDLMHNYEATQVYLMDMPPRMVAVKCDESRSFMRDMAGGFWAFGGKRKMYPFNRKLISPGHMVMTPDERYIFLTEQGDGDENKGRSYLTVFDIDSNRVDRLVPTVGFVDGFEPEALSLNELAITPDGRWLIVSGGLASNVFLRFNIEKMQFDRYVEIEGSSQLVSFTCQALPFDGHLGQLFRWETSK